MRVLGNPLAGDPAIISGESGAVTLGLVYELLSNQQHCNIKDDLGITNNSKILLFSTEGDTDPEAYREAIGVSIFCLPLYKQEQTPESDIQTSQHFLF